MRTTQQQFATNYTFPGLICHVTETVVSVTWHIKSGQDCTTYAERSWTFAL